MTRASVYLRPQAARDLEEIGAFIGAVNPLAALQFLDAAEQTYEQLARRPMLGRARHFKDVRLKDLSGSRSSSWKRP
jgi:plasmid stabilization system protein ParE